MTQTWAANNGPLTKAKSGNNWEAVYTRDSEDRITKLTEKNGSSQTVLCEYVYNPQGELAQITDKVNSNKTVVCDYDFLGRLRAARYKDGTGCRYLYDANDCLTKEIQILPDGVRIINRIYDADDREIKSQASTRNVYHIGKCLKKK